MQGDFKYTSLKCATRKECRASPCTSVPKSRNSVKFCHTKKIRPFMTLLGGRGGPLPMNV